MPVIVQDNRSVKITTVLAENTLLFSSLDGTERLSHLFSYNIEVVSEDLAIDLDSLTGTDITVELELPLGGHRYFHGFISQCSQIESSHEYAKYELAVRPWFWFLTRTADCRIFQEMSVPDIIQQIFDEEGFPDYEVRLTGSYEPWNYCVQYRETDFNFISRLMEQEGIYYYFTHENGAHKLILSDSFSAHEALANYAEVPYYPVSSDQIRERDHISRWEVHQNLQSGAYATEDFNFEDPKSDLLVKKTAPGNHARADYEVYDYPGEFPLRGPGETVAGYRMEEIQAQQNIVIGGGTAQGLNAGNLFSLTGAAREDQNQEYLITESHCSFQLNNFDTTGSNGLDFNCQINAIPSGQPFRAPRVTPKPLVQGPQTAIVVGPSGEEIWTDEYGRVKLQFHWDRYGKSDETSSCWVRVSQIWAGQAWGAMHIPRIGHEVIVEFLEGDPDRPIITGRVYNGDNGVPYDLPANATQSGIKSRSSKSGSTSNFNEIRMEDKKGSEELYVHAEKDQNNIVENDETTAVGHDRSETVGNDETISIGHDRTEDVGNNESITIGNNRDEKVGVNETINIGASRSVTIGLNKAETIKVNKSETIGIAKQLTIGGTYTVAVGGSVVETYGSDQNSNVAKSNSESIGKNQSIDVGDDQSVSVGKNQATSVGEDQTISVGKNQTISVGENLTIDAGDQITIKTGKASIVMKKDGTITISGKDITLNGTGTINQKASKNIVMKGKKILQN